MRLIYSCIVLITFSVAALAQSPAPKSVSFSDAESGITFRHPENWIKKDVAGTRFFFMRPKEEMGQRFMESINLIVDPPDDLSLDEFAGVSRTKLAQELADYHELKCENVKYGKREFFRIFYTFTYSGRKMHNVYNVTMVDGKAYCFTCSALETTWDRFKPVFETMLHSIVIKTPPMVAK